MRMSLKKLLNKLIREGKLKRQETDIAYIQMYRRFSTSAALGMKGGSTRKKSPILMKMD